MKRLAILLAALLLAGCLDVSDCPPEGYEDCRATQTAAAVTASPSETVAATDTAEPTDTPQASATATSAPSATVSPTASPTATLEPTATLWPTPTPEVPVGNRFGNGGLDLPPIQVEGGFVPHGWQSTACNTPFTPERCPVPLPCAEGQTVGCNDPDGLMITPEFRIPTDPYRWLIGDSGAQWFAAFANAEAGIWQVIPTVAGESCHVRAWVQVSSIASGDARSNVTGERYRSDYATISDRDAITMQIRVYAQEPLPHFLFGSDVQESRPFGYYDGLYDVGIAENHLDPTRFAEQPSPIMILGEDGRGGAYIEFRFEAEGPDAAIGFIGKNLWPNGWNHWYLDDASVVCGGAEFVQPTPAATPLGGAPTDIPPVYIVQAGDTLWGIAAFYGVTVQALMEANGLTSSLIVVGQELIVP